eukprot:TRINITY_DN2151_c0_g2_i6.p3 TRINITY_DN2151_c0_g2~~TRINITY_DN2151_c0_g2_i6.p3  ORF type:complete len:141 (-),score=4.98 TRINITY_DN2151_c0_g2_i6:153-575(-)
MRLVCLCLQGEEQETHQFLSLQGTVQVNSRIVGSRQTKRNPVTNTESLILAQDERWRRAQHMQVEREARFRSSGEWRTGEQHVTDLPQRAGQQLETIANTAQAHAFQKGVRKTPVLQDEVASHQLVGAVTAYQGDDGQGT